MAEVSSNKVAIITGGSRGVGAATARLLASKGWNITITCTSSMDDAENVVKECEKLGVEAIAIQLMFLKTILVCKLHMKLLKNGVVLMHLLTMLVRLNLFLIMPTWMA